MQHDTIMEGAALASVVASIVQSANVDAIWDYLKPDEHLVNEGTDVKLSVKRLSISDPGLGIIASYGITMFHDKSPYPIDVLEVIHYAPGVYIRIAGAEIPVFFFPGAQVMNMESLSRLLAISMQANPDIMDFIYSVRGGSGEHSRTSK